MAFSYLSLSHISKDLVGFAGISKEIVLTSAVNIIEIWDKDNYEKAINDAAGDFAELAVKRLIKSLFFFLNRLSLLIFCINNSH